MKKTMIVGATQHNNTSTKAIKYTRFLLALVEAEASGEIQIKQQSSGEWTERGFIYI